jgi:hypothetical protein
MLAIDAEYQAAEKLQTSIQKEHNNLWESTVKDVVTHWRQHPPTYCDERHNYRDEYMTAKMDEADVKMGEADVKMGEADVKMGEVEARLKDSHRYLITLEYLMDNAMEVLWGNRWHQDAGYRFWDAAWMTLDKAWEWYEKIIGGGLERVRELSDPIDRYWTLVDEARERTESMERHFLSDWEVKAYLDYDQKVHRYPRFCG